MKKTYIILIAVVAVGILYSWSTYNRLVSGSETVTTLWAQVETQYQRRFDLIPNLVASVQGTLKQEQKIFGDLAEARAKYSGATGVDARAQAAGQVESALSRLLVIVENYPQLRSSATVESLMAQLEGTENRISVERKRFNDGIRDYNLVIKRFPSSVIARLGGFDARAYFEAAEEASTAPKVDLTQ
ncbi:MAG: LemA family protein [Patescibacteria group bacterium]